MNPPIPLLRLLFLLPASLLLLQSCASQEYENPALKTIDEHNEGFYPLGEVPAELLQRFDLTPERLTASLNYMGLLYYDMERDFKVKEIPQKRRFCATPGAERYSPAYCQRVNSAECDEGCRFFVNSWACSGVRIGRYFVTARHCLPQKKVATNPSTRFFWDGKLSPRFKLRSTRYTQHRRPYDLSIFEIVGWERFRNRPVREDDAATESLMRARLPDLLLRQEPLQYRESVYGIGLPVLHVREGKQGNLDYALQPMQPRVTIGRVMNPNEPGRSFCAFTNSDGVADIESFELADSCRDPQVRKRLRALKYKYREEKDPVLTNTDMIWGMSGSPLFDMQGRLVGIGSNVLSNNPAKYDRNKYAVYVKARNLARLLAELRRQRR